MIRAESIHIRVSEAFTLGPINFSAEAGHLICLVGPNGAGKSTLLKALAGVLPLANGAIHVDGEALADMRLRSRAEKLAWLPQQRPIAWNMRAEDVVALGRFTLSSSAYLQCDTAAQADVCAAMEAAGALPFMGRDVQALSGGEQARVHLARTLVSPANTLLLDEPCAALDMAHQLHFMETLRAQANDGRLVIAALHDLDMAKRFADRVIVLDKCRVAADASPEIALTDRILSDVFGVRQEAGRFVLK
jgi:iron complex transport system ATP-binding protein